VTSNPIIWSPDQSRANATAMSRFMRKAGFNDYQSLYQWSVDNSPAFWEAVCDFCDIRFAKQAEKTLTHPDDIMDAGWFAGSRLNYAENLLRHQDDNAVIIFYGETVRAEKLAITSCTARLPRLQQD